MERQRAPAPLLIDVADDDKTKAAKDKQGRDGYIDNRVVHKGTQVAGEKRKACVVKCRYAVKGRIPQALRPAELRHPNDGKGQQADDLA